MTSDLLRSVSSARIFDLEQLRYAGAPTHPAHAPGFNYFLHRHHARGGNESRTGASGIVVMPEHSGTHIDALAHQAENLNLHGGVHVDDGVQTSVGFRKLGVETMEPVRRDADRLGRGHREIATALRDRFRRNGGRLARLLGRRRVCERRGNEQRDHCERERAKLAHHVSPGKSRLAV